MPILRTIQPNLPRLIWNVMYSASIHSPSWYCYAEELKVNKRKIRDSPEFLTKLWYHPLDSQCSLYFPFFSEKVRWTLTRHPSEEFPGSPQRKVHWRDNLRHLKANERKNVRNTVDTSVRLMSWKSFLFQNNLTTNRKSTKKVTIFNCIKKKTVLLDELNAILNWQQKSTGVRHILATDIKRSLLLPDEFFADKFSRDYLLILFDKKKISQELFHETPKELASAS